MRRPPPENLADIRHPGPRAKDRLPHALCHAQQGVCQLGAGAPLLTALGRWADASGFCSAVLDLSGTRLAAFDYVMPDRAIDDRHAAWYSDTHKSRGAELTEAVAILGWRGGTWFAHVHAYWQEDGQWHLGHLLPDTLTIANSATVCAHGLSGARFEASLDSETEFTLFRVKQETGGMGEKPINALITTLAPFTDLYNAVQQLCASLPGTPCSVHGLGSLAGAEFQEGPAMTGLISEIVVQKGASVGSDGQLTLPVRAVDLNGVLYQGHARPGACPTLVTNELLLIAGSAPQDDTSPFRTGS